MKSSIHARSMPGFTLVELLVVMAIIGILASLIVPATVIQMRKARIAQARVEMSDLATSIVAYQADYSTMPTTSAARSIGTDLTWGTFNTGTLGGTVTNSATYQENNSEIVAILADLETNRDGTPTVNAGHAYNRLRHAYMSVKYSSAPHGPGVGDDGVYRDLWGNPYIISLNLDGDEVTWDAFYRLDAVSLESGIKGYNGLTREAVGGMDNFVARGNVIIWSFGPDGLASPAVNARFVPNLDNLFFGR